MKVIKKTPEFTIVQKRSGRYGIKTNDKKWVSGAEKVRILVEAGLIKAPIPKKEEEAPAASDEPAATEAQDSEAKASEA